MPADTFENTPITERLKDRRRQLPDRPGIYKYFDKSGALLYIGKAKNLRKRVNSYFAKNRSHDYKTNLLVGKIHKIEYVVTNTEQEALILENNLIKDQQPRYNIELKDGKSYPYICIKNERFPRVFSTRKKIEDGSTYYGPFPDYTTMRSLKDFIRENFKIRTCALNLSEQNIQAGKFRPCLEYHIQKCKAPCVGWQTEEEYNADIEQIKELLRGNYAQVIRYLNDEMKAAAEALNFERAEELKHRLAQVKRHKDKATVVSEKIRALEVVTIELENQTAVVNHFKVDRGTIIRTHALVNQIKHQSTAEEILEASISKLRADDPEFSPEVLVNIELPEASDLHEDLDLRVPQIGDKRKLLDLSLKNCRVLLKEKADEARLNKGKETRTEKLLRRLQEDLRLVNMPRHIECFDNSNIQGYEPVASCVVFKDGRPSKQDYRTFKVKTVVGPDDFASMREVVKRRYKRLLEEEVPLPDLVVIDGGKGQLSSAQEALHELGVQKQVPMIGIAKRLEEIYYPGDSVPLYIDKKSPSLHLLQRVRDEAHRFAVTFHRKRRSKATLRTTLTDIPGVGPKTAKALLERFGSTKRIRDADLEELQEVCGPKTAAMVKDYLLASNI